MSRLLITVAILTTMAALSANAEAASFEEVAKLTASDAQTNVFFGESVALSGDTVVVGASWESEEAALAGAAYVYLRDEGGADNWGEVAKLAASDAVAFDEFGEGVAVSGSTAIVGALGNDAEGTDAGAAYVFDRNEGGSNVWGEVVKLTASDAEAEAIFGRRVAISGDTAVVGASGAGVGGERSGSAYVFQRDEGGPNAWGEVARLTAPDAEASDRFGSSVAISGDIAVVGASWESAGGMLAGAAYVFQRDQGGPNNWGEVARLTASDAEAPDEFGESVAVSGLTVVVGAHRESGAGINAGAVYVFQRDEGGPSTWGEVAKLTASDGQEADFFGGSVAVAGDNVLVGAKGEDTEGTSAGAIYVFQRNEGGPSTWSEIAKLTASDAEASDNFGISVAIDGTTAVVGASGEDAGGNQAGASYVFATTKDRLTGDASCDGTVNAIDAAFVLQFNAALLEGLPCPEAADANEDGVVNAVDAALILQLVAGLLEVLPP